MQLSMDLLQADHVANTKFRQLRESTAYITLSGCVLDHIVVTNHLSSIEKLFYILVNALSIINSQHNNNQRSIALSAESWAKRLNCSKSQVFILQKSLSDKGYFIVSKDKNRHGQNKRNLICPTLPDSVFKGLCKSHDRVGQERLNFSPISESKLQYLDRTKLFIMLGYQVLKDISACEYLTPFHKLVWLDFYSRCYKTHMANSGSVADVGLTNLGFSFITSYQQLEDRYSCDKRLLSVALIELEEMGLIKREHFYVKKEFGDQDRQDKSLWKISLLSPEQLSPDAGSGTKPGDSFSSNHSASFSTSHNTGPKMLTNARPKIFNSTNILPNVVPTLTLEQKNEYYINDVIYELEDENKGDDANVKEQDPQIQNVTDSDIITTAIDVDLENANTDKPSGVILPIDPEFQSFNIYNNINTKLNISKSNLDVVNNTSSSSSNKNNLNSLSNKTTEYDDRFKNGWQNNICGEVGGKNEHRGVSRRLKKSKENIHEVSGFNVCTLLIKEKLKILSKDKADKARKFAYSLFSKELTKGYSSSITKHELAKQFIHHAATWKPTKISDYKNGKVDFESTNYNKIANGLTDEQQIDIALSVAWNSVVKGTWQEPLEWKKAKALQYEYLTYKKKYRESGVISKEIQSLEVVVNTLLSGAGGKEPGVDLGGVGNNKGEIAGAYKAYGYDLAWKIRQEVDQELDRLGELEATNTMVAGFTAYQGQIGNTIQSEGTGDEFIENMVGQEAFMGDGVASNHVMHEATGDNCLTSFENLSVGELEKGLVEEHSFLRLYCSSTKNTNSSTLQEDLINTNNPNTETKRNWSSSSQHHIEVKSPNDCQLEKVQCPVFKDLRELTIKNNDNGQQIYFKLLDAKSLDGVGHDNSSSDLATNNCKEYLARLKLIEVNKFGDIVMILDSNQHSSYSFGKKGDYTSEVSLASIGISCDEQVAFADDCLSVGSSSNNYNYHNEPINYQGDRKLKDFIKIDNAIANIFKNLKKRN